MAKLTPQEFASKWSSRLSGATSDIQRGVERVDQSPTEKAAARKDKWLAGIQQAAASGKWERGLRSVTTEQWKQATISKGIPRISAGATAAQPKMADFAAKLLPYQDNLRSQISKMPDLTLDQNIARMTEWIKGMSKMNK